MGRCCSQGPHSSISPWRVRSSPASTRPALGTEVMRGSRWMVTTTSSPRSSTRALGRSSSSDMATSRPSRKTRRAPTSVRTRASTLGGGSVPWLPYSRIRSACKSCCSTCRLRAWSGRESRADRVPARGVSLPSARTTKRRSCSPPGTCEKRYTMRAQVSSALGRGLASASPALAASPWPSAMAAAARCSQGRTRPGQSQSHSFSPGYKTTVGATARPGVRTRRTISSSLRDSTATAPARTRLTPLDQRPLLQDLRSDASSLVRWSGIQYVAG